MSRPGTGTARWFPPLAYTLLLFGLSSIPGTPTTDADSIRRFLLWMPPALQNVLHVPQYALLSWLWCRAGATPRAAVVCSVAYAVFEETYQVFVPGRFGSFTDLALDVVGIAVGVACFRRSGGRRPFS